MTGWIQLHRSLQKWEWYTDVNTCHLFLHLLLSANHKQTKWRGQTIKVGQLMTGRKILSTETGLTEQQIRTCLKRLESTSEITITKYNKYSIITVTNWNQYQQKNDKSTSNQPATNQQPTTSNNINNINNDKKKEDDFLKYKNTKYLLDKTNHYVSLSDKKFVQDYDKKQGAI